MIENSMDSSMATGPAEYPEDEWLALSGIQHFEFCKRQWALIHIEEQWRDNTRTYAGETSNTDVLTTTMLLKNAATP